MNDLISRQLAIKEVEERLESAYVWFDDLILKDDYRLSAKADGTISAFIECVLMLKGLPSAEPEPCDFCIYDRDCEEMRIYCPARGRNTNGEV